MKRYLSIILTSLISICAWAQINEESTLFGRELNLIEFASPNEWSFHKYIENPISLYTGCPDVSITLFTLKDGDIEIPITLRYNTSGIKVEEEASWVGLGWNLNLGGVITKNIVAGDDDRDLIFEQCKSFMYPYDETVNTYGAVNITEESYEKFGHYQPSDPSYIYGKFSPDVYYFSYPGNSGKYVVDHRDSTVCFLVKENDLEVSHYDEFPSTSNDNKTIITPEGIMHFFQHSYSTGEYGHFNPISETFLLTSSQYPSGDVVSYTYTIHKFQKMRYSAYTNGSLPGLDETSLVDFKSQAAKGTSSVTCIEGYESVLERIRTPNYIVEFSISARDDHMAAKKLDALKIKDVHTGNILKQFLFEYDYFKPDASVGLTDNKQTYRLKLKSVEECSNGEALKDNRYSFEYNNIPLPPKNSYSSDYWGYANSSKHYPEGDYLPAMINLKNLYDDDDYPYIISAANVWNTYDKSHNEQICQAGMLTEITYPTGGRTVYSYESNTFWGKPIPSHGENSDDSEQETTTISATIMDRNSSTDSSSKSFTITGERTINISYDLQRGTNSWYDLQNSKITIPYSTTEDTRTLIDFGNQCLQLFNSGSTTGRITGNVRVTLKAGTHVFQVILPDELGDQNQSYANHGSLYATISYEDTDPQEETTVTDSVSYGCGMRVSAIEYYDSDTSMPLMTRRYLYENPQTGRTSGKLFDIPRYHRTYEKVGYTADAVSWAGGVSGQFYVFRFIRQFEVYGTALTDNPYGRSSGVGYGCVREITDNIPGETQYYFINNNVSTNQLSYRVGGIGNGKLTEKRIVDSSGNTTSSHSYTYTNTIFDRLYGISLHNMANKFPGLINFNSNYWTVNVFNPTKYGYFDGAFIAIKYNLNTYDIKLSSERVSKDGVTTLISYTYDTETLLPKSKTVTLNNGSALTTTYKYPKDINGYPYITLYDKHILTPVVEEQTTNNGALIYSRLAEINSYGNIDALYYGEDLSQNISGISSDGVVNTSIYPHCTQECIRRDSRQNPVHYRLNETEDIIYIWGYGGRYPVAEIKGASYAEVQTALGCTPESLSATTSPDIALLKGLQTSLPEASVTLYNYDRLGNIIEIIDPRGHSTCYEYDGFGRLIKKLRANGSSIETTETFKYNTTNKVQ